MSYHLNCIIDREMRQALEEHQERFGMQNISQATRDILRRGLGMVTSEAEAGWREGYNAAFAEIQNRIRSALKDPPLNGPKR